MSQHGERMIHDPDQARRIQAPQYVPRMRSKNDEIYSPHEHHQPKRIPMPRGPAPIGMSRVVNRRSGASGNKRDNRDIYENSLGGGSQ